MMEKIVNIRDRIESKKHKRLLKEYRGKIAAIRKITHCSSCRLKCAMCGQYLNAEDAAGEPAVTEHEYIFCCHCRGEFEDFLSMSREGERTRILWHNEEWRKMWSAWLQYQQATKSFIHSSEFESLVKELDNQL